MSESPLLDPAYLVESAFHTDAEEIGRVVGLRDRTYAFNGNGANHWYDVGLQALGAAG